MHGLVKLGLDRFSLYPRPGADSISRPVGQNFLGKCVPHGHIFLQHWYFEVVDWYLTLYYVN